MEVCILVCNFGGCVTTWLTLVLSLVWCQGNAGLIKRVEKSQSIE